MRGIRVHRGFQDWGDVDTYEFQLACSGSSGAAAAQPSTDKPTMMDGRGEGVSKKHEYSAAASGGSPNSRKVGTFAARAAEAEEVLKELRAELGEGTRTRKSLRAQTEL